MRCIEALPVDRRSPTSRTDIVNALKVSPSSLEMLPTFANLQFSASICCLERDAHVFVL